jgi:hypothetical protein
MELSAERTDKTLKSNVKFKASGVIMGNEDEVSVTVSQIDDVSSGVRRIDKKKFEVSKPQLTQKTGKIGYGVKVLGTGISASRSYNEKGNVEWNFSFSILGLTGEHKFEILGNSKSKNEKRSVSVSEDPLLL